MQPPFWIARKADIKTKIPWFDLGLGSSSKHHPAEPLMSGCSPGIAHSFIPLPRPSNNLGFGQIQLASDPSFLLVTSGSPRFVHKQNAKEVQRPWRALVAYCIWYSIDSFDISYLKRTAYGYVDSFSVHYPLLGGSLLSSKDSDPSSLIFGCAKVINETAIRTWSK